MKNSRTILLSIISYNGLFAGQLGRKNMPEVKVLHDYVKSRYEMCETKELHYAPPPKKTEKEKSLHGEAFMPLEEQLIDERAHCTGTGYSFKCIDSFSVQIARGDWRLGFGGGGEIGVGGRLVEC